MNIHAPSLASPYAIDIQPLNGRVAVYRDGVELASSTGAKVMYETRLPPTIYFPPEDIRVPLSERTDLQTFCPFKGTASYCDLELADTLLDKAVWSYENALLESEPVRGYVGFMPKTYTNIDLGENILRDSGDSNISGPLIDWLLREAAFLPTPEAYTTMLAEKMLEHGIAISRLSVMIWSLHPMIAGKSYIWRKGEDEVTTFAPSYEIFDHPSFVNSPLRHVSKGLGGVRQKINSDYRDNSFPIIEDLKKEGATDYVAMPLSFSDGRKHVLTLTGDHPDGFTTANLGLVFECSSVISRFYEVFMQKENAQSLLETYVGKRTGARVLGGEIRRGDGDEIDAAIMFCDLRGSTRLEELLGRAEYITLLNEFFETTSTIVHESGGEVLKFIGDAVLAVFLAGDDAEAAKDQALQSARAIVDRLARMRTETEALQCDCSIGIDYGRVTYGNVGSRERLDFTVIGQAANIAARLGDYGKKLGHRIVVSEDIVGGITDHVDLGAVELHNVSRPVPSFAIPPQDI
jgi:adenylate cyclase